ncbi:hypothetical protein ACFWA4_16775 [Streptomyces sp. NPDC060011]|uniref:hypothetical protein n=2 Tax=unclassified Streptomyces TaxID=2593676 RepID=UPI003686952A
MPPQSEAPTAERAASERQQERYGREFGASGAAPSASGQEPPRFPRLRPGAMTPPPPAATARFPDTPPATEDSPLGDRVPHPAPPSRPGGPGRSAVPGERPTETTRRLRPIRTDDPSTPAAADPFPPRPTTPAPPAGAPGAERPFVSFAEPETSGDTPAPARPFFARPRTRTAAAAACVVLGLGLIGGAVTGSWLTGDDTDAPGSRGAFAAAGELWHSVPVDRLFPPSVRGDGAGPGGSDRTWTRIAVAPDTGCANAFDPLLRKALAPVGCLRLLRATYVDATLSHVTTVGLLFTKGDAAAMTALKARFGKEDLDRRTDLMPRTYPAKGTPAADFGDAQRASWTESVLTDAPVVVFAVSGFADGRTVTAPQPAADAMKPGATTTPAQAGLGHEAQGLADRVERSLRKTVTPATEKPS